MGKQRITITLSQSVLKKVDHYIDGVQIRNRSHAIESLLEQSFSPTVDTAVILSGGVHDGSEIPALKKVGERYVLAITLEKLRKVGISRVVICAGGSKRAIKEIFGDGSQIGLEILYTEEKRPLGTAGALVLAEKHIDSNDFFVIHADILSDIDFSTLIDFHLNEDALATMVVKPALGDTKYGHVYLKGNKIDQFLDSSKKKGISIINTGIYLVKTEVLALLRHRKPGFPVYLEKDIFPQLAQNGELTAFVFQGFWYDVTSSETYSAAVKQWMGK
jgi:NDP-sugar pyrophosphorylase family protein